LKYSAADITTPIPRSYLTFLWYWWGAVGHSIRVRIGEKIFNNDDEDNGSDSECASGSEEDIGSGSTGSGADQSSLSHVAGVCAEKLATLGRVRTLNLGVQEKVGFVNMWTRTYGKAW
jgi:1-acylglycerol-3-phosphate O-acyltransferase